MTAAEQPVKRCFPGKTDGFSENSGEIVLDRV
jgi:hypothetical protein